MNSLENGETSMKDEKQKHEREAWGSPLEFFLSCLGYAVGFGNVWRFPFLCYKNGGAAFLIPYGIMLVVAGIPLFFMELALGQYASLGPSVLFANIAPIMTGIGYAMLMICFFITVHYNVIFAWGIFYFIASFSSELPWSHCNNDFNTPACFTPEDSEYCLSQNMTFFNGTCMRPAELCSFALELGNNLTVCQECDDKKCLSQKQITINTFSKRVRQIMRRVSPAEDYFKNRVLGVTGTTWDNMGSLRWELVGCLFIGWFLIALCLIKGVKSSGKVIYFTATLPYVIMLTLLIRGLTLEGAYQGIEFYLLKPNLTKVLEIEVWNDAATQIFYSLGSSCGVLITLSSYNKLTNNCLRDAMTVSICNSATSIFAGLVIFSVLGFMANELGVEVGDVVRSGSGLAFVAYPGALAAMPVSWLWSIMFFAMLISLGISSQFSYVETLSSSIYDHFEHLRPYKPYLTFVLAFTLFLSGLTMCLDGGAYMLELFVWYSSGISLIAIGLIEILAIQYIYGFKNLIKIIQKDMEITIPRPLYIYFSTTWLVLTPLSLAMICVVSIIHFAPAYYDDYYFPDIIQYLGWAMCLSSIVIIPIAAIIVAIRNGKKDWRQIFLPTMDMCPADERKNRAMQRKSSQEMTMTSLPKQ